MKRRQLGVIAGGSVLALAARATDAAAQTADASLLKTTLTPLGAERAGNAAGTIPPWTGGFTTVPADWTPGKTMPPDFFAGDQPLYVIDASSMANHASVLSDGVQHMIQNQGMKVYVYPTHRTAAAPQWVYDNTALNVSRAQLSPKGGRFGFSGAINGPPFPIPDTSDPLTGGAQIVWNHITRWSGQYIEGIFLNIAIPRGEVTLASVTTTKFKYPYYDPNGTPESFNGYSFMVAATETEPATQTGFRIISFNSVNPLVDPSIVWTLLQGQGRVRKDPNQTYDTPSQFADGIVGYDEYYGFNGALDRYDWKYLGKQEMLIPYNNNKLLTSGFADVFTPKMANPEVMRWELHRVWVVEGTLHSGDRNVLARRRLYVDEDTWAVGISDAWDASGNIFHHAVTTNAVLPNLPGTIMNMQFIYNLQTGDYVGVDGSLGQPPYNQAWSFYPTTDDDFSPQEMAASAAY